jgi:hypothetical protein
MSENIAVINAYLQLGQPKHRWDELVNCPKNGTTKKPFDNSYAVNNASRLLASGKLEEDWLMEQYPQSPKIQITPFASAMGEVTSDNGKLFFDVFGI